MVLSSEPGLRVLWPMGEIAPRPATDLGVIDANAKLQALPQLPAAAGAAEEPRSVAVQGVEHLGES